MHNFMVGAGKAEIKLADILFPNHENFVRILDPLHVRVVLIQAETRIAIVSLELTSLMGGIDELRLLVGQLTGTDPDQVWITVNHTFSAPHISLASSGGPGGPGGPPPMSPEEIEQNKKTGAALLTAVQEATETAKAGLKMAVMKTATGHCLVNSGRDVETAEGWWLGEGSPAYSDKALPLVRFDDVDGNLIAVIYNFAVQSSVLDHAAMPGGGFLVSGDISGDASRIAEERHPGSVALFLCGAAGDQAPRKKASTSVLSADGSLVSVELGLDGISVKNALGQELGEALLNALEEATPCSEPAVLAAESRVFSVPAKVMPDRSQLKPGKNASFPPDGYRESNVDVLRIGQVAIVGAKPELSAIIGTRIREASPFSQTLVATMVNGGAKYMADKLAYQRNTYAAQNSPFAEGAAELLLDQATELLKELAAKE